MKDFWKKYKEYIYLFIFPIILGIISIFSIKYLTDSISAKNNEIEKELINNEEREKRIKNISTIEKQFKMIEEEKDKLNVFITQDQVISLIKKMEHLSEETGNEIIIEEVMISDENTKDEAAPQKTADDKNDSEIISDNYIQIKISLRGSYGDAVNFIKKIENINYCSDIISLKLTAQKKESAEQLPKTYTTREEFTIGGNLSSNRVKETNLNKNNQEAIINSLFEIVFYLENQ